MFQTFGLIVSLSLISNLALAGLGQRESSVDSDMKAYSATVHKKTVKTLYTVHEMTSNAVSIREYVSNDGVVFAVTWAGPVHPSLSTILADYFPEFSKAQKAAPKVRGMRSHGLVKSENVVVERFGHMGAMQGKAYAPSLVPHGVSLSEIQ
jgi:hypothetical protein